MSCFVDLTDQNFSGQERIWQPGSEPAPSATANTTPSVGRPALGSYSQLPMELSEDARRLIDRRLEPTTVRAYRGMWERYCRWCQAQGVTPDARNPETNRIDRFNLAIQVANFIAAERKGLDLGHSACKTRVAAISTRLRLVAGFPVGEEPLVTAIMFGVRKEKPELPRYHTLPDIALVWHLFDKVWPDNRKLDTRQLVGKVSSLLLMFGLRKSDQVKIDVTRSEFDKDAIRFRALTKETRNTLWVLQPIPAAPRGYARRCAVRAVNELMRRRHHDAAKEALFTNAKDGKPVTTKWLSSCVTHVLQQAGIDTTVYRPHCLRGMGSSRALVKGFPEALVQVQFRWSPRSDTDKRHYLRFDQLGELANAVYK